MSSDEIVISRNTHRSTFLFTWKLSTSPNFFSPVLFFVFALKLVSLAPSTMTLDDTGILVNECGRSKDRSRKSHYLVDVYMWRPFRWLFLVENFDDKTPRGKVQFKCQTGRAVSCSQMEDIAAVDIKIQLFHCCCC